MTDDQWIEAFGEIPHRIHYGEEHARGYRYYLLSSIEIERFVKRCFQIRDRGEKIDLPE